MRKRRWGGKTDHDMAIYGYFAVAVLLASCLSVGVWLLVRIIVGCLLGRQMEG